MAIFSLRLRQMSSMMDLPVGRPRHFFPCPVRGQAGPTGANQELHWAKLLNALRTSLGVLAAASLMDAKRKDMKGDERRHELNVDS